LDAGVDTYDVVIIGGGPVGENAAARAVRGGLTVALVERELYGGECSYWACIPSKALLRPVELRAAAMRIPGLPVGELDVEKVLARRDSFVGNWDDTGQEKWVVDTGIAPIRGHGRLMGERMVEVTGEDGTTTQLTARHAVVLATGTAAAVPPIPGLREAEPWTSREATSLQAVPPRLVILGGGVVACEMAMAVRGLGGEVTVLERGAGLLGRMEPWAGELVAAGLRDVGVVVRTGTQVTGVRRDAEVTVTVEGGETVVADEVLCALGRHPATDDLGVETVGLEPGRYVNVDDSLRADGFDWLYAVGDVNGRALLTHMGKYQGRICGDVIAARAKGEPDDSPSLRATSDHAAVPQVVFTDPQACSVGLTEAEARERGIDVRVASYDLGNVAGGSLQGDGYSGRAAIVVDAGRRVIVGATFVGPEVADLLHAATVAVVGELTLDQLWHAVPSFPTVSEVWLRLLEEYGL
jgi:pyruvate/2-oxoglutarate dehydrogenase complex dihydrolipoamide dehydrogenase (E3) component